jgi:integrase
VRRVDVPYVFVDRKGNRLQDVRAAFNGALRRAGIKDFHFHDLRHTFASHLVMFAGAPHLKEFEPLPRSRSRPT